MNMAGEGRTEGTGACPVCGGSRISRFFEIRSVPVLANFLHATREEAMACPRGDIVLGLCEGCGFISNLVFDPSRLAYEEGYENPLHFSAVFDAYSARLARGLVERFGLRGKKIVEVGCGDGTFLELLCRIGENRGTGFDPSYPASLPAKRERFEVVRDIFSEAYVGIDADFYLARHTLEHIRDPKTLLEPMRRAMGGSTDAAIYIEVPNASHTLRQCFVWDIIYEHPSYFTSCSLANAMEMSGWRVDRVYEAFSGQFLCAEARSRRVANAKTTALPDDTRSEVADFEGKHRRHVEQWRIRLDEWRSAGKKFVVWGAGSKGIMFMNMTGAGAAAVCAVDINPKKHGKFVSGSGCGIVAPSHLESIRPDVVVVANPVYREEIEAALRRMGLAVEMFVL